MKLAKTIILVPWLLSSVGTPAAETPAPVRVALMDFSTDDSVYQNDLAARDFSAAVQAAVARDTHFELVEREQLARAAQELGLSKIAQAADDARVRVGKWVKADLLVLGHCLRNGAETALVIEVVDLDHADVLATHTTTLAGVRDFQRGPLLNQVPLVGRELNALLQRAAETHKQGKLQTAVALRSLQRIENRFWVPFLDEGTRHTLALFPDMMVKAFQQFAETNHQIRLIQFPRANRAMEEAELIFAGLAQSDSDAWKKLADLYVWTDLVVSNLPAKNWGGPNPKQTLTLAVHIWDGHDQPRLIQEGPMPLTGGWADTTVAVLCERTVGRVLPAGKPSSKLPFDNEARQRLSRMLVERVERADKLGGPPFYAWPDTPENRRQLSDLIQTLEIACFFDPQNRVAQEKLVSTRWGNMVGQYARDPFRFAWRACDAWGSFVERFGFGPAVDAKDRMIMVTGGVAGSYVTSAMRLADKFLAWNTVPQDVPENVLEEWNKQIGMEFATRALAVTNRPEMAARWPSILHMAVDWGARRPVPDPKMRLELIETLWPRCVEAVRRAPTSVMSDETIKGIRITCRELGKPELATKFLSALDSVGSAPPPAGAPANAPRPPAHPSAPSTKPNDIPKFALPRFPTLLPEYKARLDKIALPSATSTHPFHNIMPVNSLLFFDGKLWVAVTAEETNSVPGITPDLAGDLTPARDLVSRLWVYDPATREIRAAAGDVSRLNVVGLCAARDRLWLAGEEVACLDPATAQVQRFGISEGMTVRATEAVTQAGDKLFIAGGTSDLFTRPLDGGRWARLNVPPGSYESGTGNPLKLSAAGGRLLFSAGTTVLYDIGDQAWKTLSDLPSVKCAASDDSGVWLGGGAGLSFVEAKSGAVHSWRARPFPAWQAPNGLASGFLGAEYAQAALGFGPGANRREQWESQIIRSFSQFRKQRQEAHTERRKAGRSQDLLQLSTRLRGEVTAMASDRDFLWIGCDDQSSYSVILMHKPTHAWVGHLKVPARVSCLAFSDTRLWIGLGYGDDRVFEVNKQDLLSIPRSKWMQDEVGEAELGAVIAALPAHSQALYAFFAGDYARAAQLLEKEDLHSAGLETLFLLAFSYDDLGLDKPDLVRRCFQEIISRYANSPWAKVAVESLAAFQEKRKVTERDAVLLAKYDRNHDGVLDKAERLAMEKDPAYLQEEKSVNDEQLEVQIGALVKKYDRNADGKLDGTELAELRSSVVMYSSAPPELLAGRKVPVAPLMSKNFPSVPALLKKYDVNKDGGLNATELKTLALDLQKNP